MFGIYITKVPPSLDTMAPPDLPQADVLGYGWRAPYVLAALPGLLLALLLATTVSDPRCTFSLLPPSCLPASRLSPAKQEEQGTQKAGLSLRQYLTTLARSFLCSPSMLVLLLLFLLLLLPLHLLQVLLLAACFRHTAGYCWAFNTRLFFQVSWRHAVML